MFRASGQYGELRVSYQHAARLGPWRIELERGQFVFRSTIIGENEHWIQQHPLDLVLPVANVVWIWRDVELARDGASVSLPLNERPITEPAAAYGAARRAS